MQEVINNGKNGFTLTLENGEVKPFEKKSSYIVSLTNNIIDPNTITESEIIRFLDSVRLLQTGNKNICFGFWYDPKTTFSYLDISLWSSNINRVIEVGILFNQISIYDLENERTILL